MNPRVQSDLGPYCLQYSFYFGDKASNRAISVSLFIYLFSLAIVVHV